MLPLHPCELEAATFVAAYLNDAEVGDKHCSIFLWGIWGGRANMRKKGLFVSEIRVSCSFGKPVLPFCELLRCQERVTLFSDFFQFRPRDVQLETSRRIVHVHFSFPFNISECFHNINCCKIRLEMCISSLYLCLDSQLRGSYLFIY